MAKETQNQSRREPVNVAELASRLFEKSWNPKAQTESETLAESAFTAAEDFARVAARRPELRIAEAS